MNQKFPDVQAGFRKDRGTRAQIADIFLYHGESKEISGKTCTCASLTTLKPLTLGITALLKILEEMVVPDHLIQLLRNLYMGQEATVNQT